MSLRVTSPSDVPGGPASGDLGGTYPGPTVVSVADVTTGVLTVPNGGSGAATLTGLVKGNGASAMTAVAAPTGAVVGTTDTQTLTGKTITASGNTLTDIPGWVKVTKTYANFSTAAMTNSITLYTLPAGGVIHAVKIKHSTAFSGTGIASYTVSVGKSGSNAKYASAFDVFQAVASSTLQVSSSVYGEDHVSTTTITATATSTGANLNAASGAGSVDIWLLVSTVV